MAVTSGRITSGTSNYTYFYLEWQQTGQSTTANETYINWQIGIQGTANGAYWGANSIKIYKTYINGVEVYGGGTWGKKTISTNKMQLASGSATIPHNGDGTKSFNANFTAWLYASFNTSASGDFELPSIPRYANITTWQVNGYDETSVTCQWGADAACDYIQYSLNYGGWTDWYGYPFATLSGLTPNTDYNLRIRVKRADSQLWSESGYVYFKTYDYPKPTYLSDFTIGGNCTVTINNPLGRTYTCELISNNNNSVIAEYSGAMNGNLIGFNSADQIDRMYKSIPNSSNGSYYVKVTYNGNVRTKGNAIYYANANECKPVPEITSYEDVNTTTLALTGDKTKIINGYASVKLTFKTPSECGKLYSTIKSANINGVPINISDTTFTYNGLIGRTYILNITDSRNITGSYNLTISDDKFINYTPITINGTVERNTATDGKAKIIADGKMFTQSFGTTTNNVTIKYRYKKRSESGFSNWYDISSTKGDSIYTVSNALLSQTFDYRDAFDFEVQASDSLSSSKITAIITSGEPVLWWNKETLTVNAKLKGKINNYSNEEEVIGTWNGKPLYRKVIYTTQTGTNIDFAHNINNIEWVINKNIIAATERSTYFENNGTFALKVKYANHINIGIDVDTAFQGWGIYITLEYTKITD